VKKQVWLTPEESELLLDILEYAKTDMQRPNSLVSQIDRMCKQYCARRVDDLITKIGT
jgi:uncharacterized protein YeeX (DUF496 family)